MSRNLMYIYRYLNRLDCLDDWEIMVLQQTKLNALNQQIDKHEVKIGMTVLFKPYLSCADGSDIRLTVNQMNDIISRMYRRVQKLAATKASQGECNVSVPSMSGYCNTENKPYAHLVLGVPNNYSNFEFVGLVDGVLRQCPFVDNCIYDDLAVGGNQ